MFAFGETGFGTCRSNSFVNNFFVTKCRDYFLGNGDLAALGAFLSFGKSGFGAGCVFSGDNYFIVLGAEFCSADVADIIAVFILMAECRNLNISGVITSGAGFVCFPTGFGAGRCFCCVLLRIVLCGRDRALFLFTAGAGA